MVPRTPLTTPASNVWEVFPVYWINSSSIWINPTNVTAALLLWVAIVVPSVFRVKSLSTLSVFVPYLIFSLPTRMVPSSGNALAEAREIESLVRVTLALSVEEAVSKSVADVRIILVAESEIRPLSVVWE